MRSVWIHLMPSTQAGRASAGLLACALAAFAVMNVFVMTGETGGETFSDNWLLAGPGFAALICLVASSIIGAFAVMRRHERSPFALIAIAAGAAVLIFLSGEVLDPH